MNIWFNHWFSTAYHFIRMLKEEGYHVIATNERETCVYRMIADEFYIEPVFAKEEEYVSYCLQFCKDHDIRLFFVKRGMAWIVRNRDRFEQAGITVICEKEKELFNIFQNKVNAGAFIRENGILKVPEMRIVNTAEEFAKVYGEMKERYDTLCIKYNVDEGGLSYKAIRERIPNIYRIRENMGLVYSYEYVYQCLNSVERFSDLIVMPYLDGTEVSIDCLGLGDGLLALPRYKLNNRVTKFDLSSELTEIAENFYRAAKLEGPFNIQLRYDKGELYFLEVNTRMAGGAWKAELLGCRFPVLCAKKFLGTLDSLPVPAAKELKISDIEGCVALKDQ